MSTSSQRVRQIFQACLREPDHCRRAELMDRECSGDESLRREVMVLLNAHDDIGDFLEEPVPSMTGTTAVTGSAAAPPVTPTLTSDLDVPWVLPAGTLVGAYRIGELIGEGGMGQVYAAEQVAPIKRQVALKVIRPGMDSRDVIARFQAEQQALALMQHPHIARVLDVGITARGLPFFVMELARGPRITEFCDQRNLSVNERLKLFLDALHAVQHAHQRGIIHRDIKPSNVLVSLQDGTPVVKVIDFGVAKALSEPLTDSTLRTRYGELIGTPMYMSPEQADFGGVTVDTRTDVYSLGVLLYRLLTGKTPFDPDTVRSATLDELRRMIRQDEPLKPSTQVASLSPDNRTAVSAQRQLDPHDLPRLLRGDLDWITMKAMEKDRNRRYESVEAFAADVERYFRNEPVTARPPSTIYLFQKFCRRHSVLLTTSSLVVLALMTGTTLALLQTGRALRAEAAANLERDRARQSERRMQEMLYAADVSLAADAFHRNDAQSGRDALARHQPAAGERDLRGFEWYYLKAHSDVDARVLLTSESPQYHCHAIPETNQVACCGADGVIRLFDVADGRLVLSIPAGQGELNGLDTSSNGLRLASVGDDGSIRLWNLATGQPTLRIAAHPTLAFQVAFSPDNQTLLSCGNEPQARLWSAIDGAPVGVLDTDGLDMESLSFASDGLILLGARRGVAFLYQFPGGQLTTRLRGIESQTRSDSVNCLGMSSDGTLIADGHGIGVVNLRLRSAPDRIWKQLTLTHSAHSLAFSPDNQWLAAGDRSGTITMIPLEDTDLAEPEHFFLAPQRARMTWAAHEGRVYGLTFSADSLHVISAGEDGRVIQWTPRLQNPALHLYDWSANRIAFDRDSSLLVLSDALYRYSRTPQGSWEPRCLDRDKAEAPYGPLAVAAKTGQVCWAPNQHSGVRVLDDVGRPPRFVWEPPQGDRVTNLAISPDARLLAAEVLPADPATIGPNPEQRNRYLALVEIASRREITRIPCSNVTDLDFSPDGSLLAFGISQDMLIVDTATGNVRHRFHAHPGTSSEAFKADGDTLATVGDRSLAVWNPHNAEQLWLVTAHEIAARYVQFSPDGQTIFTIGDDGMLRCWRWQVQRMALQIPLLPGPVANLAVAPDGTTVVVHYRDGRLLLFDVSAKGDILL